MDTPTPTPLPQDQPPQSTGGTTTSAQAYNPPADPSQSDGGGFLSHVGHVLVGLGGQPQPSYSVDPSTGQETAQQGQASPGQLFKNLLVGALQGMAAGSHAKGLGIGGGIGLGFQGAEEAKQSQDDRARQQAAQQFQMQQTAQKTQDTHQTAMDEHTLNGLKIATANNDNMVRSATLPNEIATIKLQQTKLANDLGLTNGQDITDYNQVTPAMWDDIKQHKGLFLSAGGGKGTYYTMTQDPYKQPNDKDFQVTVPTLENGKIVDKVLATVPAGKATMGAQLDVANRYATQRVTLEKTAADIADANARTTEAKAQAAEANARVGAIADELKDKKQQKQVTQDWGSALTEAGNDVDKAKTIMQQKYAKSFGLLSAAESMSIAKNGETVTEADPNDPTGKKTVTKQQRLFTNAPSAAAGISVRLANGQTGSIPAANIEAFLKANPGASRLDAGAAPAQQSQPVQTTGSDNISYSNRPFDNK